MQLILIFFNWKKNFFLGSKKSIIVYNRKRFWFSPNKFFNLLVFPWPISSWFLQKDICCSIPYRDLHLKVIPKNLHSNQFLRCWNCLHCRKNRFNLLKCAPIEKFHIETKCGENYHFCSWNWKRNRQKKTMIRTEKSEKMGTLAVRKIKEPLVLFFIDIQKNYISKTTRLFSSVKVLCENSGGGELFD